ncbi:HAMP domain-containing histidine kinase [Nocardioides sp. TRM66260-LWL]|uniref:sensor histidine kinase n=1 Tax=Nocardioides sp. TRM66260-LWL TaxID=2874478 RepID=UPI001CC34629|nr:HAMP domain-containing sensor histidine kinase [Nocardioides sp. TRM66260-LWL]MBZ5733445.1 HAMP domain-containing histidine kinase [Nocardioides sp. TRM66260-LWL]
MRTRISWLVVATTSTVVVSFVIPLCLLVRTLAEDRAISSADQQARNAAILLTGVGSDAAVRDLLSGLDAGSGTQTSVLSARGRQLGGGPPMREDPEVRRALAGEAFRVVDDRGGRVLLPVVVGSRTAVVRTSVTEDRLRAGVVPAWIGIVGLGLGLLATSVVVARQLGGRISEPLLDVARVAHRLRGGELDARADPRGTPEVQELARALNGLAERTTELLASERAAVGDLSHRLRTPVTALRLDAEAVREPQLAERLQEHIAVLQRTIDAIVDEARRPVRGDLAATCDAAAVVRERAAFWSALAEDQGRPMRLHVEERPAPAPLAADDLADLLDVLIDNVFAHTPEGVALTVSLGAGADAVVLAVEDAGPGFGAAAPRRPGTSGLGLEIVARTAAAVGGELERGTSPLGGARVRVRLPLLQDPGGRAS